MKKTWIALCASLWLLVGCNTVQGLGQDIQKAGETLEGAARKK